MRHFSYILLTLLLVLWISHMYAQSDDDLQNPYDNKEWSDSIFYYEGLLDEDIPCRLSIIWKADEISGHITYADDTNYVVHGLDLGDEIALLELQDDIYSTGKIHLSKNDSKPDELHGQWYNTTKTLSKTLHLHRVSHLNKNRGSYPLHAKNEPLRVYADADHNNTYLIIKKQNPKHFEATHLSIQGIRILSGTLGKTIHAYTLSDPMYKILSLSYRMTATDNIEIENQPYYLTDDFEFIQRRQSYYVDFHQTISATALHIDGHAVFNDSIRTIVNELYTALRDIPQLSMDETHRWQFSDRIWSELYYLSDDLVSGAIYSQSSHPETQNQVHPFVYSLKKGEFIQLDKMINNEKKFYKYLDNSLSNQKFDTHNIAISPGGMIYLYPYDIIKGTRANLLRSEDIKRHLSLWARWKNIF